MKTAIALFALGCFGRTAFAEPAGNERSGSVATSISAGVTVAGYGFIATAFVIGDDHERFARVLATSGFTFAAAGPSMGHWYAGDLSATPGTFLRLGAIPVAVGGVLIVAIECENRSECVPTAKAKYVLGAAGAAWITGTVWDVATAHAAARRYNEHRKIAVTPTYSLDGGGLTLAGHF